MPYTAQLVGLGPTAYVASSAAAVVTNPSSSASLITGLLICNNNTVSETVVIYNVANSGGSLGTPAASNTVATLIVAAGESVLWQFDGKGWPLILTGHNDAIFMVTTTASKVTVTPTGDLWA